KGAKVSVNGKSVDGAQPGQYLAIKREWKPGDTVTMNFPMPTEVLASNPRVTENRDRVAVQRGPIVYCLEQSDQPGSPALADVTRTAPAASPSKAFQTEHKADLLNGVTVLHTNGTTRENSPTAEALYMPANTDAPRMKSQKLTMIPYYAWANREPTQMQ